MTEFDRRQFLGASAGLAAGFAMPAQASAIFSSRPAEAGAASDVLVVVFLHGAMDGLNLLAPVDDPNYIAARPDNLRLSASGAIQGLPISGGPTAQDWRLHPVAAPLKNLYSAGKLAFVNATGLMADTRSHFQAIDMMERGITATSQTNSPTGWLAKHMRAATGSLAAVSTTTIVPGRLIGDLSTVGMTTPGSFQLYRSDFASFLAAVHTGTNPVAAPGAQAITAVNSFAKTLASQQLTPTPPGTSSFQLALNTIVQLIKFNVGLQVATVETNGWDTHINQQPVFTSNVTDLSNSLAKFQSDIDALGANVTVAVVTEFGRRVKSNASAGTDHGHASTMIVMGNSVNGGKVYGKWPGLDAASLNLGDVDITTDYRSVIGEILIKRRSESSLATVFPSLANYTPLGVVKG